MKRWECTTVYEIEKPWTDSERGCEYYFPVLIVEAETRGLAQAAFAEVWEEILFTDVRVKVYHGDEEPDVYVPLKEVTKTTWIRTKTGYTHTGHPVWLQHHGETANGGKVYRVCYTLNGVTQHLKVKQFNAYERTQWTVSVAKTHAESLVNKFTNEEESEYASSTH